MWFLSVEIFLHRSKCFTYETAVQFRSDIYVHISIEDPPMIYNPYQKQLRHSCITIRLAYGFVKASRGIWISNAIFALNPTIRKIATILQSVRSWQAENSHNMQFKKKISHLSHYDAERRNPAYWTHGGAASLNQKKLNRPSRAWHSVYTWPPWVICAPAFNHKLKDFCIDWGFLK